jgi:hypothetical protein
MILDGDGYTMKRSAPLARGDFLVGSFGRAERRIIQDGWVHAQGRVQFVDTIKNGARNLDRSYFTLTEQLCEFALCQEAKHLGRDFQLVSRSDFLVQPRTSFNSSSISRSMTDPQ